MEESTPPTTTIIVVDEPITNMDSKDGSGDGDGSGDPKDTSEKTPLKLDDTEQKVSPDKIMKYVEINLPIVKGTITFWLGKKASEYNSHKWTVYVRRATNEDLSVVVKRVIFQLHPSFPNPTRVMESPPFELSESGWGELKIAISLFFHDDVSDKQLELYHGLKLYKDEPAGPQSVKKPVAVETYDEVVFYEPTESFFARVQNHPAVVVPRLLASFNLPPAGLINIGN